jgi:hypothetical protein
LREIRVCAGTDSSATLAAFCASSIAEMISRSVAGVQSGCVALKRQPRTWQAISAQRRARLTQGYQKTVLIL